MKKKLLVLLIAIIGVIMLTGCVQFNVTVDVKDDDKVDISCIYATSSAMKEYGGESYLFTPEELENMKNKGWNISEYTSGDYSGYRIERSNIDIDEMSKIKDSVPVGMNFMSDLILFSKDGRNYTIDMIPFDSEQRQELSSFAEYINMGDGYMTFTVNLPEPAEESNADYVSNDGKSYTWDVLNMTNEKIHMVYEAPSSMNILLLIVVIAIAVVLIVVVRRIIVAKRSRLQGESFKAMGESESEEADYEILSLENSSDTHEKDVDEEADINDGVRFCDECGSELKEGKKFCTNCGKRIE